MEFLSFLKFSNRSIVAVSGLSSNIHQYYQSPCYQILKLIKDEKKSLVTPKSAEALLHMLHVRMDVEHFSNSSIANYMRSTKLLCAYTGKLPDALEENDIYNFLLHFKKDRKLSRSTIRNYQQGLRFMYKCIYKYGQLSYCCTWLSSGQIR